MTERHRERMWKMLSVRSAGLESGSSIVCGVVYLQDPMLAFENLEMN